ncbi:hypothetical protein OHB06_51800 [Streptomyces sp. NBC_01604]|uniref:hypothetical protein n=1 Tax=Streptomyces sp. NBC_01604 TaxID=2975894 RepID=UPI003863F3A7
MSFLPWRRTDARPSPRGAGVEATYPLVLRGERMVSNLAGVLFSVRIEGAWRFAHTGPPEHHDPAAVTRDHLRRQAARVLRGHSVLNLSAAQDASNTVLGRWSCPMEGLEVGGTVHLDVSAHDRRLAEEHTRRQQTNDLAHGAELHRLAYLQHILADRDLRRVWWIAQFPDRFGECDALARVLQDLPSPREAEEDVIREDIRRFTDKLLTDLHSPQQREVFLTALVQTLHALGHNELKTAATHFHSRPPTGSETA